MIENECCITKFKNKNAEDELFLNINKQLT